MSTEPEPPTKASSDISIWTSQPPTKVEETVAALENKLVREQDGRREERFFWIMALFMLGDATLLGGWHVIPVLLLQLIMLIGLAKWLGVDWVVVPMERLLDKWTREKTPNPTKPGNGTNA